MQVRLRNSSGVYFPITKSALLIPPWSRKISYYIQKNYSGIKDLGDAEIVSFICGKMNSENIDAEEILHSWNTLKKSKDKSNVRSELSVYADEYTVLSRKENSNEDSFSSYSVNVPEKYKDYFEQIAVVDRLTVTEAFVGFTRIVRNEAAKVRISQKSKPWLPAVELTGEGIFIRFNADKVAKWRDKNFARYSAMRAAYEENGFVSSNFSEPYVMLHTFAHLFIREISNMCGYSAASITEKIYSEVDEASGEVKMCGLLVYVSSSDSDSSLGGLISIADNVDVFEKIVDSMLDRASWCSGDPLCISSMKQGYKSLNYAACHDCTLLPETSCECFNCLLDRASIVGLPDNSEVGFFSKLLQNQG